MKPSIALINAILAWQDLLRWEAEVAYIATEVAVDADNQEAWDDLRWDLDHDRNVLATQLDVWGVDEDTPSDDRRDIERCRSQFAFELNENSRPSAKAEKLAAVALEWLRDKRVRQEAAVRALIANETPELRESLASMWSELGLVEDQTPP